MEPSSYSKALKDPKWREAIKLALNLMLAEQDAVRCKRVCKIKFHYDGTIERYKARLVASGYTQQREGFDYQETFEPVARFAAQF